jgi:hypothetical protein
VSVNWLVKSLGLCLRTLDDGRIVIHRRQNSSESPSFVICKLKRFIISLNLQKIARNDAVHVQCKDLSHNVVMPFTFNAKTYLTTL